MTQTPNGTRWSGRTTWVHRSETPLRAFLGTETGSAAVLLGATVAALVWATPRERAAAHAVGSRYPPEGLVAAT